MTQKVIVTGGAGYIGSHTVVALQQAGYAVAIIDNLCNATASVIDRIAHITGQRPAFTAADLLDEATTEAFFAAHDDAVAVIHFAALKAVGESVQQPVRYYDNNLRATLNLFKAMDAHAIPHFIFSSSATVYGKYPVLPVPEDAPIFLTTSPYGATKRMIEIILQDTLNGQNSLQKGIALRYFNPIGAHPSALIGESPRGIPNNLLPFITQTAAGLRAELQVFGNDYDTPDGTAVRDYLHVVDLAAAHVKALQYQLSGQQEAAFEVFNLGTGQGFSVLQMIEAFERVNGVTVPYRIAPRRAGDEPIFYCDATRAHTRLGWKAQLGIDDMVGSAWRWEQYFRAHLSEE